MTRKSEKVRLVSAREFERGASKQLKILKDGRYSKLLVTVQGVPMFEVSFCPGRWSVRGRRVRKEW